MTTVLVLGGGCREHAIVCALARSPHVRRVYTIPRAERIERELVLASGTTVRGLDCAAEDADAVLDAALRTHAGLVVLGSAEASAHGVADKLRAAGVPVCGVGQDAVRLEASKDFGSQFMRRHCIPTPRSVLFDHVAEALAYIDTLPDGAAVKDDGFADGSGVLVCAGAGQARDAVEMMFRSGARRVVVQDRCVGPEFSVHALVSGDRHVLLDSSQDYKRLLDGDLGPNTGGVGSVSPVPWLSAQEYRDVAEPLVAAFAAGCLADGIDYRGIVYFPVMMTADGPRVLEINVRFGNPEAQSILERLNSDAFELLHGAAVGDLPDAVSWSSSTAVTVAACVSGYPRRPCGPVRITGLDTVPPENVRLFLSSGVRRLDGAYFGVTGRLLTVTSVAPTMAQARRRAYQALVGIDFAGRYYRSDVAGAGREHGTVSPGSGVVVLVGGDQALRRDVAAAAARLSPRILAVDESDPVSARATALAAVRAGALPVLSSAAPDHVGDVYLSTVNIDQRRPDDSIADVARWALVRAFAPTVG